MAGLLAMVGLLASTGCKGGKHAAKDDGDDPAQLPPGAVPVDPSSSPPLTKAPLVPTTPPPDLVKSTPLSFAPIARAADASVVTISTESIQANPAPLPPSSARPRKRREREVEGLGTGFIVDKGGTILTNNHVIEGAAVISVRLADDREFPARVIGRDQKTDIAVVKIDASGLVGLALGDSDATEVGDWVVAIGNPFRLSHTVSAGIVSAKGRTNKDVPLDPSGYYEFIQTDASINPGNSGGPLLNLRGEVVGINSAIRGGGAQGIGFAIPINLVKQLMPMLLRDGHVTRSGLNVHVLDVRDYAVEDRSLLKLVDEKGAVVTHVEPGGAGEKAGLLRGDVIIGFDSQPIDKSSHLVWLASTTGVGRTVTLRVSREGKLFDVKATLGPLSNDRPTRDRGRLPADSDRQDQEGDPQGAH